MHCPSNTGYAITPLEKTFYEMSLVLVDGDSSKIHFAYPDMNKGPSTALPENFGNYLVLNTKTKDMEEIDNAARYIRKNKIDVVFGFDLPVKRAIYKNIRKAGVRKIVSYWGAPMSSIFGPIKRILKKIDVALSVHGPDHYIFESHGMADTAVLGRGILRKNTSVAYLGIDTNRFRPAPEDKQYAFNLLGIPEHKKLFFYAGHMEPRKGIATIMQAANAIAERRNHDDCLILLFGNKNGEEIPYLKILSEKAKGLVMFGGYRTDLNLIQRSCYAAIIASSGWDSFPRSGVEMQASGLPLIYSDLPGLREAGENNKSGLMFQAGNDGELALKMELLLDQPLLRDQLSHGARRRAEERFSAQVQLNRLVEIMRETTG